MLALILQQRGTEERFRVGKIARLEAGGASGQGGGDAQKDQQLPVDAKRFRIHAHTDTRGLRD